ncbi:uncharacterized protein LOC127870135 [Dreissena polymorpha]|uniref:uncharacterized protein LOC127870135 n=1 Tax=Dreissena polymorpha TaxID=45954 RepID=UPI002263C35A|nr:uncharacterized protein LOC127870135 [Dreissena polymorpha]
MNILFFLHIKSRSLYIKPYLQVVVFVVGANDIGTKTPVRVFEDIVALCEGVHNATPSATILISELLPRARNRFNGNGYRQDFLEHWNYDAGVVNKLLREFASKVPWVRVIEHPEFHTMFGANVYLLSRDGLHLTIDGTNTVASNIETAVTSLTKPTRPTYPGPDTQSSRPAPTHTTPTYEYGPRRYSDVLSGQGVTSHGGGGGGISET